ncbi:MAG: hypothetical protein AB3N22_17810 [Ruegeria sp.]
MRLFLYCARDYFLASGFVMWALPEQWYLRTPGVTDTGPFNLHFVRDIALIVAISGLAILHAARTGQLPVLMLGLAWPALHAASHLVIWVNRGLPLDTIALVNLAGIQLPDWTSLAIAFSMQPKEHTQ